jgi:hypothetical protein
MAPPPSSDDKTALYLSCTSLGTHVLLHLISRLPLSDAVVDPRNIIIFINPLMFALNLIALSTKAMDDI